MRAALVLALLALPLAGCGRETGVEETAPPVARTKDAVAAAATKNTTRVGGEKPAATAAAVARVVFPAGERGARPSVVALADGRDWRAALAAASLMAPPLRAPLLLGEGDDLPDVTADALDALRPGGSRAAGGGQVVRVGRVARPDGRRSTDLVGRDPFELARAVDAFGASARGSTSDSVVVVSAERPEFAMPAAGWAAKSGDPILFTRRDTLPAPTRRAIIAHQQPRIYVLGPSRVISPKVTRELRRLGTVVRVGGADPATNAIAFARFTDGRFGWGVVDPGHGLVFANPRRPADAAAAAPLSGAGQYGPLLLTTAAGDLPKSVEDYLLDIQPGYSKDPARGVYNHGWIVGDGDAVSSAAQGRIDSLLEITAVDDRLPEQPEP